VCFIFRFCFLLFAMFCYRELAFVSVLSLMLSSPTVDRLWAWVPLVVRPCLNIFPGVVSRRVGVCLGLLFCVYSSVYTTPSQFSIATCFSAALLF